MSAVDLDELIDIKTASEDCNKTMSAQRIGQHCLLGNINGAFKVPANYKPNGKDTRSWVFKRRDWNYFFYKSETGLN